MGKELAVRIIGFGGAGLVQCASFDSIERRGVRVAERVKVPSGVLE